MPRSVPDCAVARRFGHRERRRCPGTSALAAALAVPGCRAVYAVAFGLDGDALAPATAKTHVNRTMMKLNARDRVQLVVIAYETGLITPGRTPG
jgi:Bacterial regulatory proteins, luxR family